MEFVIVIINTSSWKTNFWAQDCKNLWNRQKLEVNVSPKGLFMVILWFRIRTQLHFVENSKVLFCFALITCSGYITKSWSKFSNNSITSSWILFWKFDKLRDLIQSKLSYVVEELLSDPEINNWLVAAIFFKHFQKLKEPIQSKNYLLMRNYLAILRKFRKLMSKAQFTLTQNT